MITVTVEQFVAARNAAIKCLESAETFYFNCTRLISLCKTGAAVPDPDEYATYMECKLRRQIEIYDAAMTPDVVEAIRIKNCGMDPMMMFYGSWVITAHESASGSARMILACLDGDARGEFTFQEICAMVECGAGRQLRTVTEREFWRNMGFGCPEIKLCESAL